MVQPSNEPAPSVAPPRRPVERVDEVLRERPKTHGEYSEVALLSQGFKFVAQSHKNWRALSSDKRETVDQILHKLSRIICGDPEFPDHWDDIIGYAKLTRDRLKVPG